MGKLSYSGYCSTAFVRYFKYENTKDEKFKDVNYDTVDEIVLSLSVNELAIIKGIYTSDIKEGFAVIVDRVAKDNFVNVNVAWKVVKKVEKELATRKGLI